MKSVIENNKNSIMLLTESVSKLELSQLEYQEIIEIKQKELKKINLKIKQLKNQVDKLEQINGVLMEDNNE